MSRSSSAARRRPRPTPAEVAAARARRPLPLDALDIAPENLRAGEPPDDDIPLLADTLEAAGQLQPVTVRPGRRGERPWMVLDGRRRLLALRLLADQGRGAPDRPVDAVVETDPARQAAAAVFAAEGLTVHVSAGEGPDLGDDLEAPRPIWGDGLPPAAMTAWRDARDVHAAAADAAEAALAGDGGTDAVDAALIALVRARLVRDQIALGDRVATTLVFTPSARTGIDVQVWAPVEAEAAAPDEGAAETTGDGPDHAAFAAPQATAPEPQVEGVGHSLHALRTEVATRGLIRALADDPRTALTALIARLFLALTGGGQASDAAALAVAARAFAPRGGRPIPALDGAVRARIEDRRAAWQASGLTAIAWIHGLGEADRLAFLAEVTALTLDLREARTSPVRRTARAEAAELAALCGADIARHWTPDAAFLTPHPKAMLAGMLEAMGQAPPSGAAPGKADLVALVEATAAARRWAPTVLSWRLPEASPAGAEPEGAPSPDAEAADAFRAGGVPVDGGAGSEPGRDRAGAGRGPGDGDDDSDDGAGAFTVTAAGLAALAEGSEVADRG